VTTITRAATHEYTRMAVTSSSIAPKVLAVASGGGHWIQLLRVLPAFQGAQLVFASVHPDCAEDVPQHRLHVVIDANQWERLRLLRLAGQILRIVLRERPDVVFSTGAAPGFFALFFGRLLGARTIWLDSLANADRLSLSGRLVRPFARLWLTQWPAVARPSGPECAGSVF
jgi:UDP-N-acetylglucosamine:LPS N-acetylglucosamine transferase